MTENKPVKEWHRRAAGLIEGKREHDHEDVLMTAQIIANAEPENPHPQGSIPVNYYSYSVHMQRNRELDKRDENSLEENILPSEGR